MEDKVTSITSELSDMILTLQDGTKLPVKARTTYTNWVSGRKDCNITLEQPLMCAAEQQN